MTRTASTSTQPPFTLDTSGEIFLPLDSEPWRDPYDPVAWSDLDPFTQGYIEALIASVRGYHEPHYLKWDERTNARTARYLAFRDLAPEALAVILRDCATAQHDVPDERDVEHGAFFWRSCANAGTAPYLRDDGKVDLKDVA